MDWLDKAKGVVFGEAHVVPPKLNRKQKRQQQHAFRKRKAAEARKKHERRG